MNPMIETSEAAILSRTLAPNNGNLSREAAESILAIELTETDKRRLQQLAAQAKDGTLSQAEEAQIENYRHVGRLLELMKSKARISLNDSKVNG